MAFKSDVDRLWREVDTIVNSNISAGNSHPGTMFPPEVIPWAEHLMNGGSLETVPEEFREDAKDLWEAAKILEELEATRARANTQEDR
jgi:hypothetical protein